MADISKILKRRIAPLMVTYHYVKVYVSIIIQLEVINIKVRNFKFPIGFCSNPHPLTKFGELIVVQMAALRGDISFRYLKQFFLVPCMFYKIDCRLNNCHFYSFYAYTSILSLKIM
jgi:hypothetical protein